jgi:dephospho-CoA kinase
MLTVAITGGIGSGKSQVSQLFRQHKIPCIDADSIAREISAPGGEAYPAICTHFGQPILLTDGSINRLALRRYIFTHPEDRIWLEQLMHPIILQRMQQQVGELEAAYCLVEIPLLAEVGRESWIDRVLVVDAPSKLRIERIQKRDSISEADIKPILATQAPRKQRLDMADDVIENTDSLADLAAKVDQLHQYYCLLAN